MIDTAAWENIESYLDKISERAQKASDLLHSGIHGKFDDEEFASLLPYILYLLEGNGDEPSVSELTQRVLAFMAVMNHELSTREDRSA